MRLFIANISHKLDETDIKGLFVTFGQVAAIKLAIDRETGRRKGFGFVDMPVEEQAIKAIQSLNGLEIHNRALKVTEAETKDDTPLDELRRPKRQRIGVIKAASSTPHSKDESPHE